MLELSSLQFKMLFFLKCACFSIDFSNLGYKNVLCCFDIYMCLLNLKRPNMAIWDLYVLFFVETSAFFLYWNVVCSVRLDLVMVWCIKNAFAIVNPFGNSKKQVVAKNLFVSAFTVRTMEWLLTVGNWWPPETDEDKAVVKLCVFLWCVLKVFL